MSFLLIYLRNRLSSDNFKLIIMVCVTGSVMSDYQFVNGPVFFFCLALETFFSEFSSDFFGVSIVAADMAIFRASIWTLNLLILLKKYSRVRIKGHTLCLNDDCQIYFLCVKVFSIYPKKMLHNFRPVGPKYFCRLVCKTE